MSFILKIVGEDIGIGEQSAEYVFLVYRVISENKSEKCNSLRKLQKTSAQLDPCKRLLHPGPARDDALQPDLHNRLMSRDHKMPQQKFLHFIIFICLNALNAYCSMYLAQPPDFCITA